MSAELILHIVGARPNFMKAAPVLSAAKSSEAAHTLIHTGQHYDVTLSRVFFEELGLPDPDRNLGVGSGSQAGQTASLMLSLEKTLIELVPQLVVVYGDVNSTLAAALVAAKLQLPIAHVEAGLRSFDRSMPEEINRVLTDQLSDLLFATSTDARDHLIAEGIAADKIRLVGNPMIDTLMRFRGSLDPAVAKSFELGDRYGVVTLHRPQNVDDKKRATAIVTALNIISDELPLIVPLHPRGNQALREAGLGRTTAVHVIDPMGYVKFMSLVAHSSLVITDSGGIQEETSILGIPCLTVRPNTERPITLSAGTNRLVDPNQLVAAASRALKQEWAPADIPLWDGNAGSRIAKEIDSFLAHSRSQRSA